MGSCGQDRRCRVNEGRGDGGTQQKVGARHFGSLPDAIARKCRSALYIQCDFIGTREGVSGCVCAKIMGIQGPISLFCIHELLRTNPET